MASFTSSGVHTKRSNDLSTTVALIASKASPKPSCNHDPSMKPGQTVLDLDLRPHGHRPG